MNISNCTFLPSAECIHDCACRWCHLRHPDTDYGPMPAHGPYGFCTYRNGSCPTSYSMTCENLEVTFEQYMYIAMISMAIVIVIIMFAAIMYKIVRDAQRHIDTIGGHENDRTDCLDEYKSDADLDAPYALDDL